MQFLRKVEVKACPADKDLSSWTGLGRSGHHMSKLGLFIEEVVLSEIISLWIAQKMQNIAVDRADMKNIVVDGAENGKYGCGSHRI